MVLRAAGLRRSFGAQIVLDGVALELREGEVVLLRGDNGSGKTTLLNMLTGNLQPDAGSIHLNLNGTEEHFYFPRGWWQELNPWDHFTPERVAAEGVGRAWQDIRLFTTQNLRDNIAVAAPRQLAENPLWPLLRRPAVLREHRRTCTEADATLGRLGLAGRETSSADKVSLGQSKRVAIGRAVAAGAKVLFLDEPLSGLDRPGIEEVVLFLRELAREHRITLVIVEHVSNARRILEFADTVWTLDSGSLSSAEPHAVATDNQFGSERLLADLTAGLDVEHRRSSDLPRGARLSVFARPDSTSAGDPVLEVRNVAVRRGQRLAVGASDEHGQTSGISFVLHEGEIGVLEAPNGWGKTTLAEAIAGLVPVAAGTISMHGKPVNHLPPWRREQLGLRLLPAREHLFPSLTVEETARLAHADPELLPELLRHRRVSELSGGQKQRVALISRLASVRTKIALLDEPFSALDFEGIQSTISLLTRASYHCTIVTLPMVRGKVA